MYWHNHYRPQQCERGTGGDEYIMQRLGLINVSFAFTTAVQHCMKHQRPPLKIVNELQVPSGVRQTRIISARRPGARQVVIVNR
jgi:hypothetical protein